jgi:hypothetical protein
MIGTSSGVFKVTPREVEVSPFVDYFQCVRLAVEFRFQQKGEYPTDEQGRTALEQLISMRKETEPKGKMRDENGNLDDTALNMLRDAEPRCIILGVKIQCTEIWRADQ